MFTTRKSLLRKVRSGDELSWNEFYAAYKPLILLCGRDCGLTGDECRELVQQVMTEIFRKNILGKYEIDRVPDHVMFRYDPAHGRFRHFLRGIIRNHAIRIYHNRPRFELREQLPDIISDEAWERTWDEEWEKHVFSMACTELKKRVKSVTWLAFEMYALQNRPAEEVAEFLNVSVSTVYTARSRCVSMLRTIIDELEEN
ncbi:sigma-70 family RNA polymerase sigma factor [uncultured Victivallis sp.]|uniref:RNA polymerase sigma factor n=1 Tax=uncultured Victivallis sp. TaxID=354118 RepID=UPI0025D4590F|nr:sigma-70 family RNA polymerase sigma factor [uncultured Victivallis sp.]